LPDYDYPVSFDLDFVTGLVSQYGERVHRHANDMQAMFYDTQAVQGAIVNGDPLIYEFDNTKFITSISDMAVAITRIFPGKIGDEYYMSKGHQHQRDDQPEIYICVQGTGYLLLDTMDGEFRAEGWKPGTITHIPPMWAHRVVNTGSDTLVYIGLYHAAAGHEYALVERQGFTLVAVERDVLYTARFINPATGEKTELGFLPKGATEWNPPHKPTCRDYLLALERYDQEILETQLELAKQMK
jgi:glucose-6-phosphate isomerase, archaeal